MIDRRVPSGGKSSGKGSKSVSKKKEFQNGVTSDDRGKLRVLRCRCRNLAFDQQSAESMYPKLCEKIVQLTRNVVVLQSKLEDQDDIKEKLEHDWEFFHTISEKELVEEMKVLNSIIDKKDRLLSIASPKAQHAEVQVAEDKVSLSSQKYFELVDKCNQYEKKLKEESTANQFLKLEIEKLKVSIAMEEKRKATKQQLEAMEEKLNKKDEQILDMNEQLKQLQSLVDRAKEKERCTQVEATKKETLAKKGVGLHDTIKKCEIHIQALKEENNLLKSKAFTGHSEENVSVREIPNSRETSNMTEEPSTNQSSFSLNKLDVPHMLSPDGNSIEVSSVGVKHGRALSSSSSPNTSCSRDKQQNEFWTDLINPVKIVNRNFLPVRDGKSNQVSSGSGVSVKDKYSNTMPLSGPQLTPALQPKVNQKLIRKRQLSTASLCVTDKGLVPLENIRGSGNMSTY
eukprot:Nk52_evm82s914 gene=Nk52_evmTU82s914